MKFERLFALKKSVDFNFSWEDFRTYVDYLNKPLNFTLQEEQTHNLYVIYQRRAFTVGDIKNLYQCLLVDFLCADSSIYMQERLVEIFENGFSNREHLKDLSKELSHDG